MNRQRSKGIDKKKSKYRFINMLLVVLLITMNLPQVLWANSSDAQMDAVLVVDASLSMQTTDPNKLGLEAVKMFVDMMGMEGNQVGIVTYCKDVDKTYPMSIVNNQEDKEKIKSFVDTIQRDLHYTDITSGLKAAEEMLDSRSDKSNAPLIVVFTDGNNDLTGLSRTATDVENDLNQIIHTSETNCYPIYTVGLNHNGGLNEAYLKDIAVRTKGKAFATSDPNDLPSILTQIFADYLNLNVKTLDQLVATGEYQEVEIDIPNNSVLEANISAMSSSGVEFRISNPAGIEQGIPSQNITLHQSNTYSLLKLAKPEQGKWKLYVKGIAGDEINIELVYNYDLGVMMNPIGNEAYIGDALIISGELLVGDKPLESEEVYNQISAYGIIENLDTGNVEEIPLQVMNQSAFETAYNLKAEGNFTAFIRVEHKDFIRESEKQAFIVKAASQNKVVTTKLATTPQQSVNTGKIFLVIGLSVLGVLVVLVAIIVLKKVKEASKPLVGQMIIEIKDNATGKISTPQFKKLHLFKGKVSLHALVQFAPELKQVENIILKGAPGDKLMLINNSEYIVEKSGRSVQAKIPIEIHKGDKFTVNVGDIGQTIYMEYML